MWDRPTRSSLVYSGVARVTPDEITRRDPEHVRECIKRFEVHTCRPAHPDRVHGAIGEACRICKFLRIPSFRLGYLAHSPPCHPSPPISMNLYNQYSISCSFI